MRDVSSTDTEANFDIEQFVHTSGEGFGNDRPMDADNGSVDVAALGSVAGAPTVAGKKMSRKEKRQAKREVARLKKEAKLAEKEARKSYTSVKSQLKDRDKELTSKTADARRKREGAKDVVNYIGYNRMYQDGICEVEEGLFSSSIAFGDTSYHSVRDEIYVIDRAGEYTAIAERYGGTTYHFGVGTDTFLNPFDTVSVEHMPRTEQIAFKIDAMLAQAGASAAESGQSLSEVDQSIIQRCVELAFQRAEGRGDGLPPTLQDFYDIALEQPEHQAQTIALRYERFVKGSMDFFNRQSNVDFNTRIVDFNLKDLPDSMLVFALINVCEAVRNRMYFNAKRNVRTWLYVEEMQSLFAYPTVLNYFSRFSNEGRKFGLLLTGITQNAVAMLNNEAAQNIVLNADFIMLLKQSPLDRMRWVELLNLSEQEEECIDESAEAGDGLLIAGNARVPIRGKFPSGNVLYDLFSTNPNETKELNIGFKKKDGKVI